MQIVPSLHYLLQPQQPKMHLQAGTPAAQISALASCSQALGLQHDCRGPGGLQLCNRSWEPLATYDRLSRAALLADYGKAAIPDDIGMDSRCGPPAVR